MIDEHPCAGADLPVDESQPVPDHIGEGANERRMLAPDHQALHAPRTADQFMPPRLEQGLQGLRKYRRRATQCRHVKACYQALSIAQSAQRILASLKSNIQMQVRCPGNM